jgi:hypothetical protein
MIPEVDHIETTAKEVDENTYGPGARESAGAAGYYLVDG